jgi:DNA ligase (NAD+)
VAILEPVYIAGTTVSRSTLHNEDEIDRLDLHHNDRVVIVKSGDIIPKILRTLPEFRSPEAEKVVFPNHCPVCQTPLSKEEDGVIQYCNNINCPAQIQKRIEHFASRKAMDIEGLGEALIAKLLEYNIIEKIEDLYNLDYDKIQELENQGEKSIANLKSAIEKSKERAWDRILYALGIRFVGDKTAKSIAEHYPTYELIKTATIEDLLEIEDVGERIAESVYSFFQNEESIHTLEALKDKGLKLEYESGVKSDLLKGFSFLLTGTLANYTRTEAQQLIEEKGGRVTSSVSKKLNYLIVGENPGSKFDKAKTIDSIKIIDETEFAKLLEEGVEA